MSSASFHDRAFVFLQQLLPTRFLSWLIYRITRIQQPTFKNSFIQLFMQQFRIDLREAVIDQPERFTCFNDFFTRALKPGARPLDPAPDSLISPVDGTVSQAGDIHEGRLIQAKGHDYSVQTLLGGDADLAARFAGGRFATIYLAPYNYHRIHMPLAGQLQRWIYVPGRLFSVNPATVRALPGVFARNERVCTVFETEAGTFALVMVGALFVGSMETVWAGQITPPHKRGRVEQFSTVHPLALQRGEEMGRFNMGSTVILLAAPNALEWDARLQPGQALRMGERIGRLLR